MAQEPDSHSETSPENAELFQLIVENIEDYAILMMDLQGIVTSWNSGIKKLLGYNENEIVGQSISIIFTTEDADNGAPQNEIENAAKRGLIEQKRWYQRKDKSLFWASGKVLPLKTSNGELRGYIKIIRNDTAQKIAEDDLKELLASVTDSFFRLDDELRYTFVNQATTDMFGIAKEELLGKKLEDIFPDVPGSIFHTELAHALKEQETRIFENYYAPLDRWFESRIYPSRNGLSVFTKEITARNNAENSLRESEEKYRILFDSIDEGFCIIEMIFDENGKAVDYTFIDLNSSFEKHSGLVNAKGKRLREFVPDYEDFWFETYGRVAITGEAVRFDNYSEAFDRWWDVYAFRVGEPTSCRIAVLFNDITERKRAEIAMREAEERYRALIDSTATTVWHANPEGGLTFVGERWTEVSGQTIEEILKWGWLEALHPDDREPTIEKWKTSLANKTLYSTEFRIMTPAGEYLWFNVNAVPILEANGNVREWIGSNSDITARKHAEEERAESIRQLEIERSRLAYIFENAPAFVAVLRGSDHIFEMTNPAYLQLIGHRNVVGKTVREALPELVEQGYFEMLDDVFQSSEPFIGREMPVELQYAPNRLLEKRFVDFVFQPIFDLSGKSTGIFVHGIDITEQVEARNQAENANRLKDEFLATLSHELRTPLNAILGWSQVLQNPNLGNNEKAKAIKIIERNARSQTQLIDDILDVSRIITGKLRLNIQAVDLPNVISSAIEAIRPAAEAKDIRLQVLLDTQSAPLSGDPDRLQQVVWNLLSNAVKFTPKGGRVQLRLERVNSHIEIIVSDTGKGIEAEFLPHVFDRFRQSDGSMTRRHGGLGLGLAIVRQIVELHGGNVSAESGGKDQGATFAVHLPLLPIRREPKSDSPRFHPTAETQSKQHFTAELNGVKVLLIDDEADSREMLGVILKSCGAEIVEASSAAEALNVIKHQSFNLIISDIGMPDEDGFSLITKIRNLSVEAGGNTPAIALTAYARSEDRIQAINCGFQIHIAKPVEAAELIAVAANLAGRMKNQIH